MADIQDTDLFLVNRNNTTSTIEAKDLMAEIQDTDLLLVNRPGDKTYVATGQDLKGSLGGGGGGVSILLPDNGDTIKTTSYSLTSTPFYSPDGTVTHKSSTWELTLATDTSYSSVFATTVDDVNAKTNWNVSGMTPGETYIARVKHKGSDDVETDWSPDNYSFTVDGSAYSYDLDEPSSYITSFLDSNDTIKATPEGYIPTPGFTSLRMSSTLGSTGYSSVHFAGVASGKIFSQYVFASNLAPAVGYNGFLVDRKNELPAGDYAIDCIYNSPQRFYYVNYDGYMKMLNQGNALNALPADMTNQRVKSIQCAGLAGKSHCVTMEDDSLWVALNVGSSYSIACYYTNAASFTINSSWRNFSNLLTLPAGEKLKKIVVFNHYTLNGDFIGLSDAGHLYSWQGTGSHYVPKDVRDAWNVGNQASPTNPVRLDPGVEYEDVFPTRGGDSYGSKGIGAYYGIVKNTGKVRGEYRIDPSNSIGFEDWFGGLEKVKMVWGASGANTAASNAKGYYVLYEDTDGKNKLKFFTQWDSAETPITWNWGGDATLAVQRKSVGIDGGISGNNSYTEQYMMPYPQSNIDLLLGNKDSATTFNAFPITTSSSNPRTSLGLSEYPELAQVINGYFPLYTSQSESDHVSDNGQSDTYVFNDVTYYMPQSGVTAYTGTYVPTPSPGALGPTQIY